MKVYGIFDHLFNENHKLEKVEHTESEQSESLRALRGDTVLTKTY